MSLFIGLMSGTSADGMDAALIRMNTNGTCEFIDACALPYSTELRQALRQAALSKTINPEYIQHLDRTIAELSVTAVHKLLERQQLSPQAIRAIGSHGHTLRHKPAPNGFSWQIGDPNWIAEHTDIDCIADFRRRDIAANGQGAPLVPAFHAACFPTPCMVLNLGGLANLTVIHRHAEHSLGFDTGPANALIDEWCQQHFHCAFDEHGQLARQGNVIEALLEHWLALDYFQQPPPKSTGRELFQLAQLSSTQSLANFNPLDIARTLTELSARSIVHAIQQYGHPQGDLYLCGGGVHNLFLFERLQQLLPQHQLMSSQNCNIHPDWLEAMAFAWLAWCFIERKSGNLPSATGAVEGRVLGGLYPAN